MRVSGAARAPGPRPPPKARALRLLLRLLARSMCTQPRPNCAFAAWSVRLAAKDTHVCRDDCGLVHVCRSQQWVSSGSSRSWPLYTRTLLHISSMVPRHGVRRSSCSWRLPHTLLLNKTSRSSQLSFLAPLTSYIYAILSLFNFFNPFPRKFPSCKNATVNMYSSTTRSWRGLVPPPPLMGDSKLRYSKKGRFRQWRVYWLTV